MTEGLHRLAEAKKYQKMAFMALLPESAEAHLNVIEKEFSVMMSECLLELIKQEAVKMATAKFTEYADFAGEPKEKSSASDGATKGTKRKVTID